MNEALENGSMLLIRAVHFDDTGQYFKAYEAYRGGLQVYMDYLKVCPPETRETLRARILKVLTRAEDVKKKIEDEVEKNGGNLAKTERSDTNISSLVNPTEESNVLKSVNESTQASVKSISHEEIKIAENDTGYSYKRIFKKCLQPNVHTVKVEDAYVRKYHQLSNFLRFCELVVKKCKNLKKIILCTSKDEKTDQETFLKTLGLSLSEHGVVLELRFSDFHDRKISFNNGWVVKIGRGLHYFKPRKHNSIGTFDMDLAPCFECTADIFLMEGLVVS